MAALPSKPKEAQKHFSAQTIHQESIKPTNSKDSEPGTEPNGTLRRGPPPPALFAPIQPQAAAVAVLHQLCAFEQVFQEIIARRDGLDRAPIRASWKVTMDFEDLTEPYLAQYEVNRDPKLISKCFRKISTAQSEKKDNVIPHQWLDLIEKSFLSFHSNLPLQLRSCPELDGQIGLYRSRPPGLATKATRCIGPDMNNLQFLVFSLPSDIGNIHDAGFEPLLTSEYEVEGQDMTLIGLGPARTIDFSYSYPEKECSLQSTHSCVPNVYWDFEGETLTYLPEGSIPKIGFATLPIHQKAGVFIRPGARLTAFYSDYFAENICDCKDPTYHQQAKSSEESSGSEYNPNDSEDDSKPISNPFMKSKPKRSNTNTMKRKHPGTRCPQKAISWPQKNKKSRSVVTKAIKMDRYQPRPISKPAKTTTSSHDHSYSAAGKSAVPFHRRGQPQSSSKSKSVRVSLGTLLGLEMPPSTQPSVSALPSAPSGPTHEHKEKVAPESSTHTISQSKSNDSPHLAEPSLTGASQRAVVRASMAITTNTSKDHPAEDIKPDLARVKEIIDISLSDDDKPRSNSTESSSSSRSASNPQLLEAFLNSQKIVLNQQELLKAQMSDPKSTEATIKDTQDILRRNQATQDKLREMLWG